MANEATSERGDEPAVSAEPDDGEAVFDQGSTDDEAEGFSSKRTDPNDPFEPKTFGSSFVWARTPGFIATVLRIRAGENVAVSTQNRKDMVLMLTAGRGLVEIKDRTDVDHVELLPAVPVTVIPDRIYRLIAMTEVELFTIYSPS